MNGKRIEPEKLLEIKVKDTICFGTPISNNSFRYVLEQLTTEDYQLVQEQYIAEQKDLSIKKKPCKAVVVGTSDTGTVSSDIKEVTSDKTNSDEVAAHASSSKKNEMLLSIQEEFLCVICQELFVKAHSLSCSHSFCEKCINEWMKKNRLCPICRKTIAGKPCPSIALDNAVSKLVECLPEEAQKERAELLEERSPKKPRKDVILISDSPVRPTTSGVVTRSARRRNIPVNLVSSDSSSSDSSELSNSESSNEDEDDERYDDEADYFDDYEELYYDCDSDPVDYTGLPGLGHTWGGYGHCYRCGMCWSNCMHHIFACLPPLRSSRSLGTWLS